MMGENTWFNAKHIQADFEIINLDGHSEPPVAPRCRTVTKNAIYIHIELVPDDLDKPDPSEGT